jgi:hypothetical protein
MVIEVLETDQVDDYIHISTLENICRNEKLVSEHSERKERLQILLQIIYVMTLHNSASIE